jgi:hypothetical protein
MSLKDAKIRYLTQELDDKERRIQMMKDDTAASGNPGAGSSEERIAVLEKKMKELEALVKGLTEELLDLKSIAMRLNRASEERRAEIRRVQPVAQPAAPGAQAPGSTVVMQKKGRGDVQPAPAQTAQQAQEEGPMDLIMQPDGTMKMEKRRGDRQYIIATGNFRKGGAKDARGKPKQDLIVAEDEEKTGSGKKK